MFDFKQNKIKTKKCNIGLELKFQSDKKGSIEKFPIFMTSAQQIIDQELAQFGWVGSIATNSISDFESGKESFVDLRTDEKTSDLIDTFICHSIFYVIFCYSLCLYVFIDLGFGCFLKNKVNSWLKVQKIIDIPSLSNSLSH